MKRPFLDGPLAAPNRLPAVTSLLPLAGDRYVRGQRLGGHKSILPLPIFREPQPPPAACHRCRLSKWQRRVAARLTEGSRFFVPRLSEQHLRLLLDGQGQESCNLEGHSQRQSPEPVQSFFGPLRLPFHTRRVLDK